MLLSITVSDRLSLHAFKRFYFPFSLGRFRARTLPSIIRSNSQSGCSELVIRGTSHPTAVQSSQPVRPDVYVKEGKTSHTAIKGVRIYLRRCGYASKIFWNSAEKRKIAAEIRPRQRACTRSEAAHRRRNSVTVKGRHR